MFRRLIAWWRKPACPAAEVYEVPSRAKDFRALFGPMAFFGREHCINCGLSVDPSCGCSRGRAARDDDRMRSLSVKTPERDADFWDIAKHESEAEPGRVAYQFLGMTGEEEA